jgi:hypothetical protein
MGYKFIDENKEHLHTLDGKPLLGTTTVLEVIAKPLTWWASGLACAEFGWMNPKPYNKPKPPQDEVMAKATAGLEMIKGMNIDQYLAHLNKAYRAHKSKLDDSADKGIKLHEKIETWILGQMGMGPGLMFPEPELEPFIEWSKTNIKKFLAVEKCHYSEKLWIGGRSDILYQDFQDRILIGDNKSSKQQYFSHLVQMGGYAIEIEENGLFEPNGAIVMPPLKVDGAVVFAFGEGFKVPEPVYGLEDYKESYKAALTLYKHKKKFEGD